MLDITDISGDSLLGGRWGASVVIVFSLAEVTLTWEVEGWVEERREEEVRRVVEEGGRGAGVDMAGQWTGKSCRGMVILEIVPRFLGEVAGVCSLPCPVMYSDSS